MELNSFLKDYVVAFLENKDSILKKIKSVERNCWGFDFCIHYKDIKKYFLIKPLLDGSIFEKIKDGQFLGIISLSNPENIKFLISNWKTVSEHKGLALYFINPFSSLDKVWIICPYVHNKICDASSLELGLKSMAELVDPISIKELEDKIKGKR